MHPLRHVFGYDVPRRAASEDQVVGTYLNEDLGPIFLEMDADVIRVSGAYASGYGAVLPARTKIVQRESKEFFARIPILPLGTFIYLKNTK